MKTRTIIERSAAFFRKCRRNWWVLGMAVVVPTALVWAVSPYYRLGLNLDKSLNCRLYLIEKGVMPAKYECIAFRCRDLRPYFPKGFMFIKRLVAGPGDKIDIGPDGKDFHINGQFAARARDTDSYGRPVRAASIDKGPLCPTCYFVMGDHPMSYDSRYWGYVSKNQIVGKAHCLF